MKLHESLTVGAQPASVIKNPVVRLEYRSPGRASFLTDVRPAVGSPVHYQAGLTKPESVFFGYVENYQQVGKEYLLQCHEMTRILKRDLSLYLQHPTLLSTLEAVTERTGLKFQVPEADYANTPIPAIAHHGSGYALFDQLGEVFGIPMMMWQQQNTGQVFVGSWQDSVWAKGNIPLPAGMLDNQTLSSYAEVPLMARLRPGAKVNGTRIRAITIQSQRMALEWMS